MSLDDESPTQYYGADAEVWRRPDGTTIQLNPARILHLRGRLEYDGWILTAREPLVFGPDALSPDRDYYPASTGTDITDPVDTGHREGCAFGRTARCTCTYLALWDRAASERNPMDRNGFRHIGHTYEERLLNEFAKPVKDYVELPGGWCIPESQLPEPITVLNNPEERWVPGDQLPPRETGR